MMWWNHSIPVSFMSQIVWFWWDWTHDHPPATTQLSSSSQWPLPHNTEFSEWILNVFWIPDYLGSFYTNYIIFRKFEIKKGLQVIVFWGKKNTSTTKVPKMHKKYTTTKQTQNVWWWWWWWSKVPCSKVHK